VTPKGGRTAIEGFAAGADGRPSLRVRVAEPPDKGRANDAVRHLLAKALGVAPSAVRIEQGEASRTKSVRVTGVPEALLRVVEGWATSRPPSGGTP
jgi:uncharacterized protein YggU (UPF0235/DUF167 family)